MNRFFRRMQRFGKSFPARRSQGEMPNTQDKLFDARTPQDVDERPSQERGARQEDRRQVEPIAGRAQSPPTGEVIAVGVVFAFKAWVPADERQSRRGGKQ